MSGGGKKNVIVFRDPHHANSLTNLGFYIQSMKEKKKKLGYSGKHSSSEFSILDKTKEIVTKWKL